MNGSNVTGTNVSPSTDLGYFDLFWPLRGPLKPTENGQTTTPRVLKHLIFKFSTREPLNRNTYPLFENFEKQSQKGAFKP